MRLKHESGLGLHLGACPSLAGAQKAGQLIQADSGSITSDFCHYGLGSILNGGGSLAGNNEFAPRSEWLTRACRFYEGSWIRPMESVHLQ